MLSLFIAVALTADGSSTQGAELIDDVKLVYQVVTCQDGALPDNINPAAVKEYCDQQKPRFVRFKEHWGTTAGDFLAKLRPTMLPPELVYPFGGGDMMMALTAFPDQQVYTTMSLEQSGDPRKLRTVKDAATLKQALAGLLETTGSTLLSNDSKSVNMSKIQRGELPGQLSMHLIGLALHDYEPVSARFFRIEPDGTLHYFSKDELDAVDPSKAKSLHHSWKVPDFSPVFANVEIHFAPKGKVDGPKRIHRHIAADLSNSGLEKNPGLLKHLQSKGHVAMMTKAASYLLWNASFSTMRDYVSSHLDFMFSDSTGLLPQFVKKAGLTMETYGSFQKSFLGTAQSSQAELRKEFEAQPKRALPFRFGYPDASPEKRSHLIVVHRSEPADANQK